MRHLKSEPWVISIENLYLVAGPATKTKYNPENEDKHIQDRKAQQLAALEAQWKVIFNNDNNCSLKKFMDMNYTYQYYHFRHEFCTPY